MMSTGILGEAADAMLTVRRYGVQSCTPSPRAASRNEALTANADQQRWIE
jgi:hypothetical protein